VVCTTLNIRGLGGAEGAQADPVAQVAVEAAQAALVQPLGGEQQVHAEAATDPPDGHEQVEEVGPGVQQLAELVDHHQQVRQRREGGVGRPPGRVGAQVWLVAGLAQQALAPLLLPLEGRPRPVDRRQVHLEVGDQPGHLG
jgi:hypothetical protein